MKRLALIVSLLLAAAVGAAPGVDEVVARYLKARGGLERLRAVRSLRMSGRMVLPDIEAPFVLELKRPARMRTEFRVDGRKGVRAFDGRTAWILLPLPGESPRPMPPEEAREARAQADVDLSPLVDSAAKGFRIELAGQERLSGGETWKLIVRGGDERDRLLFLDARTHLVVRTEETRLLDGEEVDFVTEIGDYRTIDGLAFPHRIDTGPKDSPEERQRLEFETIEINPALDDARFAMPRGGGPG